MDFVALMAANKGTRSLAHSALPDAPVLADFMNRERAPYLNKLRRSFSERLQLVRGGAPANELSIDPGARLQASTC